MKPSFLRLMRTYQGITQDELVKGASITKASLSAYELGKFKLASNHIYVLCEKLGIDPDYAAGRTKYPFKKANGFYKMFLSHEGTFLGVPLLEPLHSLVEFSKSTDVIILTESDYSVPAGRRYNWLQETVLAIAVRDSAGNIFILREKAHVEHLVIFPAHLKEILADQLEVSKNKGKTVRAAVEHAVPKLEGKIHKWTVDREDIEALFDTSDFIPVINVTKEEAAYLLLRRAVNVAARDAEAK